MRSAGTSVTGWAKGRLTILALALAGTPASAATEPGAVGEPGATGQIAGRVLYRGSPSPPRAIALPAELAACGSQIQDERLVVGPEGGVRDAAVWLRETPPGASAALPAARGRLEAEHCVLGPHVQGLQVGQVLEIKNLDPHPFRGHALWNGEDTAFEISLPIQNQVVAERMKRSGVLHVQGNGSLGFMTAYVVVVPHPFLAVTAADGSFALAGVPDGTYTLDVWHESLGQSHATVTVKAGAVSRIDLSLAAR